MEEDKTTVEDAEEEEKPKPTFLDEAKTIHKEIMAERVKLDEANKTSEKLRSEELMSSTAGGHIEAVKVSPEDEKKAAAKEFFKGTQLEKDIDAL